MRFDLSNILGSLGGGGYISFELTLELKDERVPVLTVKSETSSIRVNNSKERVYRVYGKRRKRGKARLSLVEEKDKLMALLESYSAQLEVNGPFEAFAASCDTSSITVSSNVPLRYIGAKCDTGALRVDAPLTRDGQVYLDLDTASAKVRLELDGPGRYPIEVAADTSSVKIDIRTTRPVYYVVEEKRLDASSARFEGAKRLEGEAPGDAVVIVAKLFLDTSSFKLSVVGEEAGQGNDG